MFNLMSTNTICGLMELGGIWSNCLGSPDLNSLESMYREFIASDTFIARVQNRSGMFMVGVPLLSNATYFKLHKPTENANVMRNMKYMLELFQRDFDLLFYSGPQENRHGAVHLSGGDWELYIFKMKNFDKVPYDVDAMKRLLR